MTTLTFAKGTLYPARGPETFHQVVGVSEGNQVRVAEVSEPEHFLVRVFERHPTDDKTNYYNWVHHALINGRLGTFTFTDVDSTAYTVRWWDDTLDLAEVAFGLWSWTTTFRVEVA